MSLTTPADLALFMNVTLDDDRAQLAIDIVEADASSIVAPLPASAKGVILTAAARGYANPAGASAQSAGGSSASWSPSGLYLTRAERMTLRRLAGIGAGAFSVNVAPGAGKCYRDPLRPATLDDREAFALNQDLP